MGRVVEVSADSTIAQESLYALQVLDRGVWWTQRGDAYFWPATPEGHTAAHEKATASVLTCRVVLLSPAVEPTP